MSGYDDWKCTDPGIEAECENCGVDTRFEDHDAECEARYNEPDYEAIMNALAALG